MLTICGLEELDLHGSRGVTHVLSILDPDRADPEAFLDYGTHHRTSLRFHDVIGPRPGYIAPERAHVEEILAFGNDLFATAQAVEPVPARPRPPRSRLTAPQSAPASRG